MNKIEQKKDEKSHLFKPGTVPNPHGRPKGSPNKVTTQMRDAFAALYEDNKHRLQEDLNALSPRDRMKFWAEMMPYFAPKLIATKAEITVKQTGAEHLSSDELTQYILEICSNPPADELNENMEGGSQDGE